MAKSKNRIFESFCGEYVETRLNKDNRQTIEMGGKIVTVHSQNIIKGFLVDEDDEYYYVGHNPETFSHAVNKRYIVHIGATNETEREAEQQELLDGLVDRPERKSDYN